MSTESKQPDTQTTGKDGATTSIKHDGDGQQGAGGLGGMTERTTPDPQGAQPHLGGSASATNAKPGSGLTENSDPLSSGSGRGLKDRTATMSDVVDPDTDGEDIPKP